MPKKVWGPKGERSVLLHGAPLGIRIHVTLITSLTNNNFPFHLQLREGTNTALDFAMVVYWAVSRGHLVPGDILVVDGAKVHFSAGTRDILLAYLQLHHVHPLYSDL